MKQETFNSIVLIVGVTCMISTFFAVTNHNGQIAHAQATAVTVSVKEVHPHRIPAMAAVVTPTPYIYTPEQKHYIALINKIWGKDAIVGRAIAHCESGINPDAIHYNSSSTDFSIFQINDKAHRVILDPEENIQYAYDLFKKQGEQPWDSSKSCWGNNL